MPDVFATSAPAPQRDVFAADTPETGSDGWGTTAAIGAGLTGLLGVGAGLVRRNPKAAWEGAKKVGRAASAVRQQGMLSGLAVPKSVLGNIGATAVESAERGTMAPLKQLFSKQTLRDIRDTYKAGGQAQDVMDLGSTLPGPTPGRIMGSIDQATRNAMQRAGLTAQEAERAVFQAPLPKALAEGLDNPVMRYLIPFRRTPVHQLIEGGKTFNPQTAAQGAMLGGSLASGAVHGAATADERFPTTVGLGAAAAAKYGLPYSLGALAGRAMAGGQGPGGLGSTAVPVSEYGIESGVLNPIESLEPAGLRLIRRWSGE